jgi:hypothetical protein
MFSARWFTNRKDVYYVDQDRGPGFRVRAVLERHQRADRAELVRSFAELETINDKPAADFWKDVAGK